MTDFDIFVNSLSTYIEGGRGVDKTTRHNLYISFVEQISNLSCNDFRLYYHKAYYLNQQENLLKSKENIDKAMVMSRFIKDNEFLEYVENGRYLNRRLANGLMYNVPLGTKNQQLADLYICAGEIYAKSSLYEESLKFYQKAQYYKSFLASDFEDVNSVSVYSFRSFNEYSLSDLVNNQITVCPSWKMNDPFDSIVNLWAAEGHLSETCKDVRHIKAYAESFRYYRIRSFAYGEENDVLGNSLMWSHYAGEHRGFCVKYNLSSKFIKQESNEKYEHMYLKKINYSSSVVNIATPSIDSNLAFATKSQEWSYENEVRLILYNPNVKSLFYGIDLDSSSYIDSIFFGYRCDRQNMNTIKNIFMRKNMVCPKFYEMEINRNNIYKMQIAKITL